MGSHSVCTCWMYWYCALYLAWWWFSEPKHIAKLLILITNIYCVTDWINYCIIAQDNGMATIKTWDNQPSDLCCHYDCLVHSAVFIWYQWINMWQLDFIFLPAWERHTVSSSTCEFWKNWCSESYTYWGTKNILALSFLIIKLMRCANFSNLFRNRTLFLKGDKNPQHTFLRKGSKIIGPMLQDLRHVKEPGYISQAPFGHHFWPIVPPLAARGLPRVVDAGGTWRPEQERLEK
jgi:hypothetical protein